MLDIRPRNQHPLLAVQAPLPADVEEPFNFFVDPADRLDLAVLVDRTGDGQGLFQRQVGQGREQCAQFGDRGAVPFHRTVRLFEHQVGGQGQGLILGIPRGHEGGEDEHALRVDRAAQFDFAFHVDDFALAQASGGGDA